MTIAILGAGNMGKGLAKRLAAAGEEVVIAARDQKQVRFLCQFGFRKAGPADQLAGLFLKKEPEMGMPLGKLDELVEHFPRARFRAIDHNADRQCFCSSHKNSSFPSR